MTFARRIGRVSLSAALCLALGALLPGAGSALATGTPNFAHVFVIVMENQGNTAIVGNTASAPYFNSLIARSGLATNYAAVAHPSLPNYLALAGGSTFGVTSDCTTCYVSAPNIADEIQASGRSWKGYEESMPAPCFVGDSYPYMQKHDPLMYFNDIRTNPSACANIVPYSQLGADLASTATTPSFGLITPNMCDDMHDCPVSAGDAWLSGAVPAILSSPAFTRQNSALFITWDEDEDAGGPNKVATLVAGPSVLAGSTSGAAYTHYSLLKTIESAWNLPALTANDAAASPMNDFFGGSAPTQLPTPAPSPTPTPAATPVVTSVSPASGPSGGGGTITISGSGFTPASTVSFGGRAASGVSVSGSTTIRATIPDMPTSLVAGTAPITVSTGGATSAPNASAAYTYTFAQSPYGVTLSKSGGTGGSALQLRAVSTVNLTPTPEGMSIFDATTGGELGHVGTGSTLSVSVSPAQAADRFVAEICTVGGGNVAAVSAPVLPPGGSGGGGPVASPSPSPSVPTSPAPTPSGPPPPLPSPTASSAPPTSRNGYAIGLSADATTAQAGDPVVLTATSNQDVGPTPYGMSIFDTTTGQEVAHTSSGITLSIQVSDQSAGRDTFVAEICNPGGANAQATSSPVVVTWTGGTAPQPSPSPSPSPSPTPPPGPVSSNGYAVTLSASRTQLAAGSGVVLTATSNQDVGPTPYGMSIFDLTTGLEVNHVSAGSVMAATVSRSSAATDTFVAEICNPGGLNVQATSAPVPVTWS